MLPMSCEGVKSLGQDAKNPAIQEALAAPFDFSYSHFPLRHLFLQGSPEPAAIAGGIRNAPNSITTWRSVLPSTSSLPLRTKALHSACLVGSSLNSSVRPRGVCWGNGVARRANVAAIALARIAPSNSLPLETLQMSYKSLIRVLRISSATSG